MEAIIFYTFDLSCIAIPSSVVAATTCHGGMASLDQDVSNTARRLLRSQDLKALTDVLADVESKWRPIGLALGLTQHHLETLRRSTVRPLSDVLKLWLQNQKQPTVEHLMSALQGIGEGTTAQRVGEVFSYERGITMCSLFTPVIMKLFLLASILGMNLLVTQ